MSTSLLSDSPPSQPASRVHLAYLDGLRGAAAFYVVLYHAYVGVVGPNGQGVSIRALGYLLQWILSARVAVDIFIVLSGYCLMLPIARANEVKGGWKTFYTRRAHRLLPPYYAALLFSLLLIGFTALIARHLPQASHVPSAFWASVHTAFAPGAILSHLVLMHNLNAKWAFAINYPMWSVALEAQIYLFFPILLLACRRWGIVGLLAAALVLGIAPHFLPFLGYVTTQVQLLSLFGFGMAAAWIGFSADTRAKNMRVLPWAKIGLPFWLASAAAIFLFPQAFINERFRVPMDILAGAATALLLLYCTGWLSQNKQDISNDTGPRPIVLRVLEAPALVALGLFSYSLYLTHAPVLSLVQFALHRFHHSWLLLLVLKTGIGIPLALFIAYRFHVIFERPFLNSLPRPSLPQRDKF